MESMTIYRKPSGADLQMQNESHRENVWGTEMLVKVIDVSDKEQVEQAKADGWKDNPQAVIDEIEGDKLERENAQLQRQIDSAKAIERVTELEAENSKLKAEITKLKADKAKSTTKTTTKVDDEK